MDNFKNILPSKRLFLADNKPVELTLGLKNSNKNIFNNRIQTILSLTEQFDKERNNSTIYRLNGQVDILSPITGIKKSFTKISDIFDGLSSGDNIENFSNFTDYFDIFVMYLDSVYETDTPNIFNTKLKPLTSINDISLFKSGYYTNLYFDPIHQFLLEKDIDVSNLYTVDSKNRFILPILDFYIFFRFKNIDSRFTHSYQSIDNQGNTSIISGFITDNIINNGLYGGQIEFIPDEFSLTYLDYGNNSIFVSFTESDKTIKLDYTPYSICKIRDLAENTETGSILNTINIPNYAYILNDLTNNFNSHYNESLVIEDINIYSGTTRLDITDPINFQPRKLIFNINTNFFEYYLDRNLYDTKTLNFYLNGTLLDYGVDYILSDSDKTKIFLRFTPKLNDVLQLYYLIGENYVWKDVLDIGYIEPDTNRGVDYPFINGKHYIFNNIKLFLKPDLTHTQTNEIFCNFVFSENSDNFINPNNNLEIC